MASLRDDGYAVVTGVLSPGELSETARAMERVRRLIDEEIGKDTLMAHGDACLARLMMKYDRRFLALLETPQMIAVVDEYLSPTAVLRYQVGTRYPPGTPSTQRPVNGNFHRNFPHIEATKPIAVDIAVLIADMTRQSAPLYVVPASHRWTGEPTRDVLAREEVMLNAPAGSMIVLDGALWHREADVEDRPSVFVNHQFTHPLIKQHFDYASALGPDVMASLSDRCRHLLGWNFRPPVGLDEFYRPEDQRPFVSSRLVAPASGHRKA